MVAMKIPDNSSLLKVINNTNESDYCFVSDYARIDECCEVIRLNGFGSIKNMPKPYLLNNKIYFGTNEMMVPFYVARPNGNKFSLFELSFKKYNELGF
jgi:hypothetical protein